MLEYKLMFKVFVLDYRSFKVGGFAHSIVITITGLWNPFGGK
jgi:hypothetical protein